MAQARLLLGDCLEVMAHLEAESVSAVVTDPPAGISFMGRAWDGDRGGRCEWIKWLASVMAEALRVAKPGAHALVWALPRTSHWTGTALEEAGWEVRDVVTHLYGEGFPKSLDVSKAIDAKLGAERTTLIGHKDSGLDKGSGASVDFSGAKGRDGTGLIPVMAPATAAAAAAWQGWGTALKPAAEFWFLARKPFRGAVADNVLEHGTGALNIATSEIGTERRFNPPTRKKSTPSMGSFENCGGDGSLASGRFPANVVLSHLADCKGSGPNHTAVLCADGCPVRELNAQSGQSQSQSQSMALPVAPGDSRGATHGNRDQVTTRGHDDHGGAARFFYIAKPRQRERNLGTLDEEQHATVKPVALMRYLVRLITPPGGVVLDPFLGSGTTGLAALAEGFDFVGIEQDAGHMDRARARVAEYAFAHSHPRPATE